MALAHASLTGVASLRLRLGLVDRFLLLSGQIRQLERRVIELLRCTLAVDPRIRPHVELLAEQLLAFLGQHRLDPPRRVAVQIADPNAQLGVRLQTLFHLAEVEHVLGALGVLAHVFLVHGRSMSDSRRSMSMS